MIYPSTIAKVALGVIGASTVAGTGFGIHSALQDKTIGDAIVRKEKTLINNKDVFQIAFKQHKEEEAFLSLIGIEKASLSTASLEDGGLALSNWCTKNLKLDLTEENIQKVLPNAEKYCSIPMMTMKEKMHELKKKLATDWEKRLDAIGEGENDDLKATLAANNSTMSSKGIDRKKHKQIWINALKHWCEEKSNIPLTWDKNDDIFKKMGSYCFEIKPEQP